ncbi:hypothetical protein NK211_13090 [Mammaliicoccus sciuri]|uniref:hypothetical protein n=1 Tax=Mammaliicoccus sciuri TaxID=1296 RepID=UPI0020A1FE28|nr:hypothetical protein [Mammaliicoccus sciuri]MCP1288314.1 hypothetical protein [Mammaliicoccus sciuri]
MPYDYDDFIDAMRFGLTMSDRDTTDDIWNMVDEVVDKAKAFNKILGAYKDSSEQDRLVGIFEGQVTTILDEYMEDE